MPHFLGQFVFRHWVDAAAEARAADATVGMWRPASASRANNAWHDARLRTRCTKGLETRLVRSTKGSGYLSLDREPSGFATERLKERRRKKTWTPGCVTNLSDKDSSRFPCIERIMSRMLSLDTEADRVESCRLTELG